MDEYAEILQSLACAIVARPEQVSVTQGKRAGAILLTLHVAEEDMGKVIGRQGRIAQALRTLLRAASAQEGKRVDLEIGDATATV